MHGRMKTLCSNRDLHYSPATLKTIVLERGVIWSGKGGEEDVGGGRKR